VTTTAQNFGALHSKFTVGFFGNVRRGYRLIKTCSACAGLKFRRETAQFQIARGEILITVFVIIVILTGKIAFRCLFAQHIKIAL
jgi:hypothetical protein